MCICSSSESLPIELVTECWVEFLVLAYTSLFSVLLVYVCVFRSVCGLSPTSYIITIPAPAPSPASFSSLVTVEFVFKVGESVSAW